MLLSGGHLQVINHARVGHCLAVMTTRKELNAIIVINFDDLNRIDFVYET